jgi:uncharacterized protein with FMN-binding domain
MGEKTSLTLKILAASLFTMLLVVFVFTDSFTFGQADSEGSADVADDALVGTAEGHNGPLSVAVTMDGDTITDVTVTEHAETEGLADPALENVPAAIVETNSTDVEVVSGATVTSGAIMAAVEDAIAGAGGSGESAAVAGETYTVEVEGHNGPLTVDVTIDGDTITGVEVTDHAETEGLADPALEEVPAAIVEANSTDVEVVSGATVTSEAIISAVEQALEEAGGSGAAATDDSTDEAGQATGDAQTVEVEGHNGPITVEVTLDGDTITAVEVLDHAETDGLADPALEEVPAAIVEANSTDVETVSGATVTSEAIIEAVNQALAE